MFKYNDDRDYTPIGAPFHNDIASEKDKKPKNDNDDRDYALIGAPFHNDD